MLIATQTKFLLLRMIIQITQHPVGGPLCPILCDCDHI